MGLIKRPAHPPLRDRAAVPQLTSTRGDFPQPILEATDLFHRARLRQLQRPVGNRDAIEHPVDQPIQVTPQRDHEIVMCALAQGFVERAREGGEAGLAPPSAGHARVHVDGGTGRVGANLLGGLGQFGRIKTVGLVQHNIGAHRPWQYSSQQGAFALRNRRVRGEDEARRVQRVGRPFGSASVMGEHRAGSRRIDEFHAMFSEEWRVDAYLDVGHVAGVVRIGSLADEIPQRGHSKPFVAAVEKRHHQVIVVVLITS